MNTCELGGSALVVAPTRRLLLGRRGDVAVVEEDVDESGIAAAQ
jgi:hypothetical protein